MTTVLERFLCVPLGTKLARRGCADRHERAKREAAGKGARGQSKLVDSVCVDCPVGAAHARGEEPARWPDGAALETDTINLPGPGSTRLTGGQDSKSEPRDEATARMGAEPAEVERGEGQPGADPGKERGAARRGGDSSGGAGRGAAAPTTKGARVGATGSTAECPEQGPDCEGEFVRRHNRQKFCPPCGESRKARLKRENQKKRREASKGKRKRSKPAAAPKDPGERLNEVFEEAAQAPPAASTAIVVGSDQAADLVDAELDREIEELHRELAALVMVRNARARRRGQPAPYPTDLEEA